MMSSLLWSNKTLTSSRPPLFGFNSQKGGDLDVCNHRNGKWRNLDIWGDGSSLPWKIHLFPPLATRQFFAQNAALFGSLHRAHKTLKPTGSFRWLVLDRELPFLSRRAFCFINTLPLSPCCTTSTSAFAGEDALATKEEMLQLPLMLILAHSSGIASFHSNTIATRDRHTTTNTPISSCFLPLDQNLSTSSRLSVLRMTSSNEGNDSNSLYDDEEIECGFEDEPLSKGID